MATLAVQHLPILIHSLPHSCPPPPPPSDCTQIPPSLLPSVFIKLIPIWPTVSESSCWEADVVNSAASVFVNTALSKHTECCTVNTVASPALSCMGNWMASGAVLCPSQSENTLLQSVFQELGDKEAYSVSVGFAGERSRRVCLVPAQLRAEPLEEAQLLR